MIFVGSQAWEWNNFIKGIWCNRDKGSLLQFVDKDGRVALADFAKVPFRKRAVD
jgi:cytochrome c oxidase subunit 3